MLKGLRLITFPCSNRHVNKFGIKADKPSTCHKAWHLADRCSNNFLADPDTGEKYSRRKPNGGDSDSDSELSAMEHPDLDLASSHSSDDDEEDYPGWGRKYKSRSFTWLFYSLWGVFVCLFVCYELSFFVLIVFRYFMLFEYWLWWQSAFMTEVQVVTRSLRKPRKMILQIFYNEYRIEHVKNTMWSSRTPLL